MGLVTAHLIKGVAAGIGLASEGIAARKAKKAQQAREDACAYNSTNTSSDTVIYPQTQPTETQFELDSHEILELDANQTVPIAELEAPGQVDTHRLAELQASRAFHPSVHNQGSETTLVPESERIDETALATSFASQYPIPAECTLPEVVCRLPAPVLLPQRRPKNRDRGFVRAYAPDLDPCGVDQKMFIDFLNTAEKGCRAHRWLQAINLAAIAGHAIPSAFSIVVGIAIHQIANLSIAADGRRRTNNFFDQANEEFFKPRGLYCLVMTWYPENPDVPAMTMDLQSTIAKATQGNDSTVLGSNVLGNLRHKFKTSNGKTYGNVFPEVAQLVFPSPEEIGDQPDLEAKFAKAKKKRDFIQNYLDKRAQASFEAENPNSYLNQRPKPTFASRYADPNHPACSGDLFALLTGGVISRDEGENDSIVHKAIQAGSKMLESKALYLAIVNMPSESELREARATLSL
ncbi:hypothetical protein N7478_009289 [Penicillium angulare]|uniref:uncharacterized protein n=1 Tax=Penicillium angulare TaxID=116970 RepID=UPI002541F785|nr:uncharacterized protein N7478_009289 [Penicillium angulare]KAJ5266481.1 hypothetical protein N7478_009289 [Penicillium angulare]